MVLLLLLCTCKKGQILYDREGKDVVTPFFKGFWHSLRDCSVGLFFFCDVSTVLKKNVRAA